MVALPPTLPMRSLLLLALSALGACVAAAPGPAAPGAAPASSAAPDTADVSVIREPGGGAVVTVAFRAASAVPMSPGHALRVETPEGMFEATLATAPEQTAEGAVVRTSATYRLAEAGVVALDAAGARARVGVHDGTAYRTHAVRRVDLVE